MLGNLSIGLKIRLGFGICLLFFAVSGFVSYKGMVSASDNFKHFGELANELTVAGRIQANFLKARISAKTYLESHDDSVLSTYDERFTLTIKLVDEAFAITESPERAAVLEEVKAEINAYNTQLQQLIKDIKLLDKATYVDMAKIEKQALHDLEAIIEYAHDNKDSEMEYYSALLLEKFLFAKISVSNFLHNERDNPFTKTRAFFATDLPQLEKKLRSVIDGEETVQLVDDFNKQRQQYSQIFEQVIKLRIEENQLRAALAESGTHLSEEIEALKLSSVFEQNTLTPELQASKERTIQIITILAILAITIGCFCAFVVNRSISRGIEKVRAISTELAQGNLAIEVEVTSKDEIGLLLANMKETILSLRDIVQQVNTSCEKVGEMSEELSVITNTTNSSSVALQQEMEQISASILQLSASTGEIATNATNASSFNAEVTKSVGFGLGEVEKMLAQIGSAEHEMETSSVQIKELYQESMNIGSILETIQGVAEQTNLLALNAAIEAARAGDQGRGFAVVADEVRTLAQRTQDATGQIESLIHSLQNGAESAMNAISKSHKTVSGAAVQANSAANNLQSVNGSINELSGINIQIAAAVEEQSMVTNGVSNNITETNNISTSNRESVETISASANELSKVAQHLDQQMKRFKTA